MFQSIKSSFMSSIPSFINLLLITRAIMCSEIKSNQNSSTTPSQHFRAFYKCLETAKTLTDGNQNDSRLHCVSTFDGIGCWTPTPGNTIAKISCPDFIPGSDTKMFANRECMGDGNWRQNRYGKDEGDYTDCQFNTTQTIDLNQFNEIVTEIDKLSPSPYDQVETAQAFEACFDAVLVQPKTQTNGRLYCPRNFDGWGCFNDTPAGQVAYISCPAFVIGFSPLRKAHKTCTETGEWFRHAETNRTWSNYMDCVDFEDYEFRELIIKIYITGYSISLVALFISLAIFYTFKIFWYFFVVKDYDVLHNNGFWCQTLHVIVHYFMVCNYFWMFCEGLYLHTLLVIAFVSENKILKWFYLLGWGVPVLLTTVYAVLRSQSKDANDITHCWIDDVTYTWLLSGPVCMSLLLNLFFLINIVRVLVTKLRAVNTSDTHQTRKAVRATLILIPLLGLQFMLTPFRPETGTTAEKFYEIISAIVTSLQGLCVSLLFCFFNGEVLANLKKKWNQTLLSHGLASDRRMSYAATTVSFIQKSEEMEAKAREKQLMLTERER